MSQNTCKSAVLKTCSGGKAKKTYPGHQEQQKTKEMQEGNEASTSMLWRLSAIWEGLTGAARNTRQFLQRNSFTTA